MQDRDLILAGLVLIGSSITVAGTTIGVILPGVRVALALVLSLATAVLVVLSAAPIVFSMPGNLPGSEKALVCRTLL
ncbi:MAG: hypothetical protein ACYDEZ_05310 [Methanoregula sp.]|jgi:hypothetical protein